MAGDRSRAARPPTSASGSSARIPPYFRWAGPGQLTAKEAASRPGPPDKPAPITIVVLPEYVVRHWWARLLYNQTAKRMKAALIDREHTVVANVPYRRGSRSNLHPEPTESDDRRTAAPPGA